MKKTERSANRATVVRSADNETSDFEWGRITFFASDVVGPATEQSVGRCEIHPGAALPEHFHPNCAEVVHVLQGTISHTIDDGRVETLRAGDTIIVPRHLVHQATNTGSEPAVLLISFSAAAREFVPV